MNSITQYSIDYISTNWRIITKKALIAFGVFIIIRIISNLIIAKIKHKITENDVQGGDEYSQKLSNIIGKILSLIAIIINILVVCEIIGIDVSLLMAGISLGLGFAMETMIGNIVSGFFIILNKKFKIGDSVELLGRFNTKGVIEEINLKHTTIRTIDKRRLLVPNTIMSNTAIKTYKTESIIRGDLSISVPRHVNIEQIKKILTDTVNENENVLNKDYTNTYILEFDDKGYKFNTIFFLDPHKATPVITGAEIRKSLYYILKKYGISFTYDHMTLNAED